VSGSLLVQHGNTYAPPRGESCVHAALVPLSQLPPSFSSLLSSLLLSPAAVWIPALKCDPTSRGILQHPARSSRRRLGLAAWWGRNPVRLPCAGLYQGRERRDRSGRAGVEFSDFQEILLFYSQAPRTPLGAATVPN
jgi:hypothetical protein